MAEELKKKKAAPAVKAKPATAKKAEKASAPRVTEVMVSARFVRATPRKLRMITDTIRDKEAVQALQYLKFIRRDASRPVSQLLASAIANAEHNFQIDEKDLFIKRLTVDEGPKLKRFRPRAHGSAAPIRYRMSHMHLTLGVKEGAVAKQSTKKAADTSEVKIVNPDEVKKDIMKSSGSDQSGTSGKQSGKGFMKGMFQRKTG